MPVITYHRPRRMRSNDVLLQQGSGMTSSNSSWFNSSYRILQTVFVVCIGIAAAFVVVLQYQSSEQLPETSIVATLESHDSSPQPTRPPTAKAHFRSLEPQKQVEATKDTSYLKVMEAPQASYPHRLDRYCARHIPAGESAEAAAAAIARQYGVALTNLVITIRHGDRSAIHTLPNATMKTPSSPLVEPQARPFTRFFANLQLNILHDGAASSSSSASSTAPSTAKGEDLAHALDPDVVFQRSDYTLPQGQLTSRGFVQHLELGQLLLRAYDALFLQKIVQAEQVYVRSTNYVRTIQSVSALLMALLPQIVQRKTTSSPSSKVTIHTFADENHEIMHGLGLRSSSHGIQAPGQASIETFGACPRAIAATKTERAHFQVTPTAMQPVIDRFGDEVRALYPPEIVDTSIPAYCHQRGLPCHAGGSAGSTTTSEECMEKAHLEHLMKDADRYYCDRYSGMHGGYEATQLATYPFLHEIQETLLTATAAAAAAPRLTIFSGHDTVIAPVLASLGLFRRLGQGHRPSGYCNWPGYASRIVFERYTPVAASTVNGGEVTAEEWTAVRAAAKVFWDDVHQQRQFFMHVPSTDRDLLRVLQPLVTLVTSSDGAGAAPKTTTTTTTGAAHWVRVVFNGDDVTQSIPACVLERWVVAHVLVQHMSSSTPSTTTAATAATASASTTLADFVRDHRRALTRLGQRLFSAPAAGSTSVAFSLCSGAAFTAQIADLLGTATSHAAACSTQPSLLTKEATATATSTAAATAAGSAKTPTTTTTTTKTTTATVASTSSGSKSGSAAPTTTATSAAFTTKPPVAAH